MGAVYFNRIDELIATHEKKVQAEEAALRGKDSDRKGRDFARVDYDDAPLRGGDGSATTDEEDSDEDIEAVENATGCQDDGLRGVPPDEVIVDDGSSDEDTHAAVPVVQTASKHWYDGFPPGAAASGPGEACASVTQLSVRSVRALPPFLTSQQEAATSSR